MILLTGINTGRFIINTTLGVLGLFDVAQSLGLTKGDRRLWTIFSKIKRPYCYVVLPILGPSTARDTISSLANFTGGDAWYNITIKNDTQYFKIDYYISRVLVVDFIKIINIENLQKFIDFYASVKNLYLQDRQQNSNSKKIVDTQNDSDWDEIENQLI